MEGLGNGVLEMDGDELGGNAARLWLDLGDEERKGTEILAPTHAIRAEINDAVREGLAEEGVLRGSELEIERYVNLRLTRSQKGEAANYRPGDVAIFQYDAYGIRARAGDACRWRRWTGESWGLPTRTAVRAASIPRATSAIGSNSTRPSRYRSGPATRFAGPATMWNAV